MDKIHKRALIQCRSKIVTDLSPENEFWDKVAEKEIFTPLMLEYIQSTNPRPDKVRKLLDDLSRRGPDAFPKFLDCLDQSGHRYIANYIRQKEEQLRNPNSDPILHEPRLPAHQEPASNHGDQVVSNQRIHYTGSYSDMSLSGDAQPSHLVSSQSLPSLSSSGRPISYPSEETQSKGRQPGDIDVPMENTADNQNQNSAAQVSCPENMADVVRPIGQVPNTTLLNPMQVVTSEWSKKYKMDSNPRGLLLIINNVHFRDGKHRPGAGRDTEKIKDLFSTLGYLVDVRENQTAFEMKEVLCNFARDKCLHNVDSLIVVLMSHGSNEVILGTDKEPIPVLDLVKLFNGIRCPAMRGKPKMFLINACRGGDWDCQMRFSKTVCVDLSEEGSEGSIFRTQPANSDFVLAYSTFPGYVSFRDEEEGSWFIQCLVKVFSQHAREEHVLDLLTMVNDAVANMGESQEGSNLMIPAPMTTLRYKWYLNPPAS